MTDAIPRWRRLEADERREQILECAMRLFGDRPYALVSTTEIAREAGVARGLLNHYFGTKRDLYVAVVRRARPAARLRRRRSPPPARSPGASSAASTGSSTPSPRTARRYVAITGAEGVAADPEVERIIAEADDAAARGVLTALGVDTAEHDAEQRAVIRAYSGLVKAAMREWIRDDTLTRAQVHLLLSRALIADRPRRPARPCGDADVSEHPTYCRICEPTCGMIATVEDGRLVQLRPDAEHPITQRLLLPQGHRVHRTCRTTRTGCCTRCGAPPSGEFERISWETALDEIGAKLRAIRAQHGGGSIGWYAGNPSAFSHSHAIWSAGFVRGARLAAPLHAEHAGHLEPVRRVGAALRQPDDLPAARSGAHRRSC